MIIGKMLEALLPGLREVRTPLVGGILWSLVVFLVAAPSVPDRQDATGLSHEIYRLADALGPATGLALVLILVYIFGAIMTSATEPVATVAGFLTSRALLAARWQRAARVQRREDRSLVKRAQDAGSTHAVPDKRVQDAEQRLKVLSDTRMRWIRRTELTRAAAKKAADASVPQITAGQVVRLAFVTSANEAISRLSANHLRTEDLDDSELGEASQMLTEELKSDPLDVLSALDHDEYQRLDRERAERDLRLSASFPFAVAGFVLALNQSAWGWLLAAAATFAFLRQSVRLTREPERVLQIIGFRELKTPAIRFAEVAARDAVRTELKPK